MNSPEHSQPRAGPGVRRREQRAGGLAVAGLEAGWPGRPAGAVFRGNVGGDRPSGGWRNPARSNPRASDCRSLRPPRDHRSLCRSTAEAVGIDCQPDSTAAIGGAIRERRACRRSISRASRNLACAIHCRAPTRSKRSGFATRPERQSPPAADSRIGHDYSGDANFVAGREPAAPQRAAYLRRRRLLRRCRGADRSSQGGVSRSRAACSSTRSHLMQLVTDRAGLGETGEVLVGALQGESVQYMFPARELRPKRSCRSADVPPMQRAIARESGFSDSMYRGDKVLAVYQPVLYQPGTDARVGPGRQDGLIARPTRRSPTCAAHSYWGVTTLVLISVARRALVAAAACRGLCCSWPSRRSSLPPET